MRSQAKASSSPAARQSPWTAATVGHGNSSRSAIVRRWLVTRSRAWADVLPLNMRTSAPPEKILPSARTIKALSGVCCAAVTAPRKSSTSSSLNRFRGGFASVSIPRAPEVSKRTCLSITASYPLTARGDPRHRLPDQYHSAEGTVFDQMAEGLGGLAQSIGSVDDRAHLSRGQQRQNGGPGGCLDRVRLCGEGEAAHAGALPDQVRDIDRGLPPCRISEGGQHAIERQRRQCVTRQGPADALDHHIHAAASREPGDAVGEAICR